MCNCGLKYNKSNNLAYHKKWECGKILQCNGCWKIFRFRSYHIKHMKTCEFLCNLEQHFDNKTI